MQLRGVWRAWFRRDRLERDLDDELQATLTTLIDEGRRKGLSEGEARRRAHVALGSVEAIKDRVREERAGAWLDTFVLDVRYGARLLWRSPIFTATAVLSLAIGIGAVTAITTLANGTILRSAPGVVDPGSLVDVVRSRADRAIGIEEVSFPDYLELARRAGTLRDVFAYALQLDAVSLKVAPDAGVEAAFANVVTSNYFQSLGIAASAGRLFATEDGAAAGGRPVAVLSHRLWTRRFNRDPACVGRTIGVNGHILTIVGVAAEGFGGTMVVTPDLWITTASVAAVAGDGSVSRLDDRSNDWLMVGGRLAPGVTRGQASAEIAAIGQALARDFPSSAATVPGRRTPSFEWRVEVNSPVPAGLRGAVAGFLGLLLSVVAVVLLVACANVASVLLARATARRREIALRVAIGAGRSRIVRQLLTETALLVMLGGTAGILLARGLTTLLLALLPAYPLPVTVSAPLDLRVLGVALAVTALAAMVAGLAPALEASRSDAGPALKDDTQSAPDRVRLRGAFVVAQVALSLMLVVIAAILATGLDRVTSADRGYDARGVEVASIDLAMAGHTRATGPALSSQLLERLQAVPSIDAVTIADRAPGAGGLSLGPITIPGVTAPDGSAFFYPATTLVAPGYFATLRIPVVEGRDFTPADRGDAEPAVIVEESTARRFWPGRPAIGEAVLLQSRDPVSPGGVRSVAARVVGVVRASGPGLTPRRGDQLAIYLPLAQRYSPQITILARGREGLSVASDLRAAIAAIDPDLPLLALDSLERHQNGPVETQLRIGAAVAGSVGLIALLLAAIGVYGVTAYSVVRRTREIGIRVALGASPPDVLRFVARQGGVLVAIGSIAGLLLGVAASRLIAGPRFSVPAAGPSLLAGAALVIATIGLVACYLPARRATRIRTTDALRAE